MRIVLKLGAIGLVTVLASACSSPKLGGPQTADARFAALSGNSQRQIAHDFYQLGASDDIKRLYWAQRRVQEQGRDTADAQPTRLQRRYVNLPYPSFQDSDGTVREGGVRAVEIVQIWKAVPSHGRTLNLCR
jgi:hypothetical protein